VNGWNEKPMLSTDPIISALLASGTKAYTKGNLQLLYSPMEQHSDGLWKHASISHPQRYPYWDEILDVRYTFFSENDEVMQVLPPKREYVNVAKNCFHLWCPVGRRLTPG
jgi:hypothetical protein